MPHGGMIKDGQCLQIKVFSCNIYRICKKQKIWNEKNEAKISQENNYIPKLGDEMGKIPLR